MCVVVLCLSGWLALKKNANLAQAESPGIESACDYSQPCRYSGNAFDYVPSHISSYSISKKKMRPETYSEPPPSCLFVRSIDRFPKDQAILSSIPFFHVSAGKGADTHTNGILSSSLTFHRTSCSKIHFQNVGWLARSLARSLFFSRPLHKLA